MTAARKLGVDYQRAVADADDARKECEQVRQTAAPGSPELKTVWQAYLNADSKVKEIEKQLSADPTVAAAEAVSKAAKAAGK